MKISKRVLLTVVAGLGLMSATANAAHHALRVERRITFNSVTFLLLSLPNKTIAQVLILGQPTASRRLEI